ncbi:hypothetical protein BABINDRAFT_159952 [Babjeviella inositovora NRRL Y-12698]|uniref:TrmE-type G domain-containing protein n=1 Tax=Babjeviella inositovora NRRL Y-12698 TaxID=984486 RepID=A0A1E3QVK9_9ASCO|nr:uncharacterized protein BABINDRAFT_159952 [Babjeviella inositovora NRRL Y-12698]ODQ81695.1 hypothetical protein BABINDRAFT_159952 [Babjeviella inositovora NRRL Y-12698]
MLIQRGFRLAVRQLVSYPSQVRSTYHLPTIYALSTKLGRAAISVVRISGSESKYIYEKLTGATTPPKPKTASVRKLYSPETGIMLDEALTFFFQGPKTYTGEDLLELHLHGGNAVVAAVLKAIKHLHNSQTDNYIRYAENGEFSRRAFQNGRFDLTEVEGIREMIDAETESQRVAALSSMKGENKQLFFGWREEIVKNVALLTTVIDFGEDHDLEEVTELFDTVETNILVLQDEINGYLTRIQRSEILLKGIKLTLLGPPNAGKSSLLNSIANREAAIVSDIAGTTRDVIDIPLDINGYKVVIGDTAGIRAIGEADKIEAEGIKRAKKKSLDGNLVILVLPINEKFIDSSLIEHIKEVKSDQRVIVVLNKCDLVADRVERQQAIDHFITILGLPKDSFATVSCLSSFGMDELLEILTQEFKSITLTEDHDPITISQRSRDIFQNDVLFGFSQFRQFKDEEDIVLATEGLKHSIEGIGKITGQSVGIEEVLGVVFSNFCIGK